MQPPDSQLNPKQLVIDVYLSLMISNNKGKCLDSIVVATQVGIFSRIE